MKVMLEHIASRFIGVEYFMDKAQRHMDGVGFNKPESNVISMLDALKKLD
jgi:hypothetical protein